MRFDHLLTQETEEDLLHRDVTAQASTLLGLGRQVGRAVLTYTPEGWRYTIEAHPDVRLPVGQRHWWEVENALLGEHLAHRIGYGDAYREYLRVLCISANRHRGQPDDHGLGATLAP